MLRPETIKGVTVNNYRNYKKYVPLFNLKIIEDGIFLTTFERWSH